MLYRLKRHPIAMATQFRHCLVLTYAFPRKILEPLIPPGLQLDVYGDYAFVAAALVRADCMRPRRLPAALGRNYILTGYRIFTRFRKPSGVEMRGLRILRSDCDSRLMAAGGNCLTHYNYHVAMIRMDCDGDNLHVRVKSADGRSDLDVSARLDRVGKLPDESVFPDVETARRYAGPLPFTFDYEAETHSIIAIKGVRTKWDPRPVDVVVNECAFIREPMFQGVQPVLSNAFYLDDVPYSWNRGVRYRLNESGMLEGSEI